MMDKSQIIAEVKKRLPGQSEKEIEEGILEFAKAHPDIEPEKALEIFDMYLQKGGAPKPQLGKYLGEVK